MSINKGLINNLGVNCFHFIGKTEMLDHNLVDYPYQYSFSLSQRIAWFFVNYFYLISVNKRSVVEWIPNRKVVFIREYKKALFSALKKEKSFITF